MHKKLITTGVLILLLSLGTSLVANAYQIDPSYRPSNAPFDINYQNAELSTILILQIIAGALLYFAAPMAVIFIGFGAWDMTMGGADTEKVEQAKKHLTWSVLGLILIILSYSAVRFVINLTVSVGESADQETAAEEPAAEASDATAPEAE